MSSSLSFSSAGPAFHKPNLKRLRMDEAADEAEDSGAAPAVAEAVVVEAESVAGDVEGGR